MARQSIGRLMMKGAMRAAMTRFTNTLLDRCLDAIGDKLGIPEEKKIARKAKKLTKAVKATE